MKPLLLLLCAVLLAGCEEAHKEPPPGLTIVCDGNGHYAVQYRDGYMQVLDYDNNEITSRKTALYVAWRQYEYEQATKAQDDEINEKTAQANRHDWHDCDK
jgi:hypothetical protein